jgi:hypothetical protein
MPVFHDIHAVTAAASMGNYFLYHRPMINHHLPISHHPI